VWFLYLLRFERVDNLDVTPIEELTHDGVRISFVTDQNKFTAIGLVAALFLAKQTNIVV
jgi:hypothetical protein